MTPSATRPIGAYWEARALRFVLRYRHEHGHGPTWAELYARMGWRRGSFRDHLLMLKLERRGLVWQDEVTRSLDVSDAGIAALADWDNRRTEESS